MKLEQHPQRIQRRPIFQKINQFAKKNGPHGEWRSARDFLEQFLKTHAPVWDYREDARQGEIEDRNYERENERIAKEIAEDERLSLARTTKLYTPDAPDAVLFAVWPGSAPQETVDKEIQAVWLRHIAPAVIRKTWPTLRELKMATAISERALQKIIKNLRPKKTETTKEPRILPRTFDASRRRFSWRGAVPLRYAPRLVVGVLNEFLNRLPEFPMDDHERKQLRKTALLVKRAFAARSSPFGLSHLGTV